MSDATQLSSTAKEIVVAEVADRFTDDLKQGRSPSIEDYAKAYPEIADIIRQVFPAFAMLERPPSGKPLELYDDQKADGQLGDFRLLREIGRGGMGVVYEAEQISIGRRVALKILPFAAMFDRQKLNRFKNEVRAAGTLDHPHIVAVYAVGNDRGVHYYAMYLVEGKSLAEIIAVKRENAKTTGVDRSELGIATAPGTNASSVSRDADVLARQSANDTAPKLAFSTLPDADHEDPVRVVAQLGIQATEALHYAHENGIVHRDIKPANLLVNTDGKLFVTDFGLARVENTSGMTMTGDVLGTLRYMSPEQAVGGRMLDERTDIYSLGASLYELIGGRPVVSGTDRQEILQALIEKTPTPLNKIRQDIPRDLGTIIHKSIAKDPNERYRSMHEFGSDLRRFVSGEQIKARRPSLLKRSLLWSRRNRTMVVTAVVTATIAAISCGAALVQAYRSEAKHRQLAEESLNDAHEAVDRLLSRIADEQLLDEPHMEQLRHDLLNDALDFYVRFLKNRHHNEWVDHDAADAYLRVGRIHHQLGNSEKAQLHYQQAITLLTNQQDDSAAVGDRDTGALAEAHLRLGTLLDETGDVDEAEKSFRQTLVLLARYDPTLMMSSENSQLSSAAHDGLALLLSNTRRLDDAEDHFHRAIEISESLAQKFPTETEYRHSLANSMNNLGTMLFDSGRWEEAGTHFQQALEREQRTVAKAPWSRKYLQLLARIANNLGALHMTTGRLPQAEECFQMAIELRERLVSKFPSTTTYRDELSQSYVNLGVLRANNGDQEMAIEAFQKAADCLEKLVSDVPDIRAFRENLAKASNNLGVLLWEAGQLRAAESAHRRAVAIRSKLVESHPESPMYMSQLATSYSNLALALVDANHSREAEDACRHAVAIFQRLLSDAPNSAPAKSRLGMALHNLGELLLDRNDLVGAQEVISEAIRLQQEATSSIPGSIQYRTFLRNHWFVQCEILIQQGSYNPVFDAADTLATVSPDKAEGQFNAACYLARCIPLIATDTALAHDERHRIKQNAVTLAVSRLREFVDQAEDNVAAVARIHNESYLNPIRDDVMTQTFLDDITSVSHAQSTITP
ncbi:MAG: serine/threonine-protein kinase [Pirellulaceae bacterium]